MEGSSFNSYWCTQLGFGTQPHYEASGDLWVELEIVLWLILGEWGYLFLVVQNWFCFSLIADGKILKKILPTNISCVKIGIDGNDLYTEGPKIGRQKISMFCIVSGKC